jgi:hypothetical protein
MSDSSKGDKKVEWIGRLKFKKIGFAVELFKN